MRLIDADNAIHALGVFSDMEHGNKHFLNGINSAKEIINECVTIDAAPVVRCKECKHYSAPVVARDTGLCLWADRDELAAPDGYCSHGATKESTK